MQERFDFLKAHAVLLNLLVYNLKGIPAVISLKYGIDF